MARRQVLLLIFISTVPLALLAVLGWRLASDEETHIRQRFQEIFRQQLHETDGVIATYFEDRERELLELARRVPLTPGSIRERLRREPRVEQIFVLDAEGRIKHPLPGSSLNTAERRFLVQITPVINDRDFVRLANAQNDAPGESSGREGEVQRTHGWYALYWGRGVNLIFWHRRESGEIVGVLLERARWMADLIDILPQTGIPGELNRLDEKARIRLVDSDGSVVYQWGRYEPPEDQLPFVDLSISRPLSSWRLQYLVAESWLATAQPGSQYFNILAGLVAGGVALLLLAVVFYREYAREMAEATQRVNFVNQVSHELKTPLTNIRMYADLLERDLEGMPPEETESATSRLGVILSESQRLSRLITNVLTFARQQRSGISIRRSAAKIDDLITACLERFAPPLRDKQIVVEFDTHAPQRVLVDVDVLEQILVNLFSNVEKYAAAGKLLKIVSSQAGDRTTIVVEDRGPGIPAAQRERIFEPFHRVSHALEDSPGTGIGLSIARDLARNHGGDVVWEAADQGARFRVTLHTPRSES
ncbi:Alginate biosynthesis sensor protein KinB [Symmachiella dynata]|uniref:sensor histidine kinase n=1 Tax=Symmachiella dynata TaxID=2527995 RepID=UPI00118BCD57|nr:HAMP domain-containing sensor histidine kinase [Symmachiella dynata]QDT49821.1 Alginate biosynthesis sensor protein KinB [Symmachiella dynata]